MFCTSEAMEDFMKLGWILFSGMAVSTFILLGLLLYNEIRLWRRTRLDEVLWSCRDAWAVGIDANISRILERLTRLEGALETAQRIYIDRLGAREAMNEHLEVAEFEEIEVVEPPHRMYRDRLGFPEKINGGVEVVELEHTEVEQHQEESEAMGMLEVIMEESTL